MSQGFEDIRGRDNGEDHSHISLSRPHILTRPTTE